MDTVNAKEPAILVDWEDVQNYPLLDTWLAKKQKNAKIVLLVSHTSENDFDHGDNPLSFEPDVVLRNSVKAEMPPVIFKTTAIVTLQESSNLVPVLGITISEAEKEIYTEAGVLFVMDADVLWSQGLMNDTDYEGI